jgi:hypothetical protein
MRLTNHAAPNDGSFRPGRAFSGLVIRHSTTTMPTSRPSRTCRMMETQHTIETVISPLENALANRVARNQGSLGKAARGLPSGRLLRD